jgi:hypothetical protein
MSVVTRNRWQLADGTAVSRDGLGTFCISLANEESDHEPFCEKEDCGYSESKMGKVRSSKPATVSGRRAAKKTVFSRATRAKLSAKLKAYWAAKKKSGKN